VELLAQRDMTPQAVGRCAGPTASVWVSVGSPPVHNTEVCLPWQYVQNGTPGSDKGFEPLPDKTKRDKQNAKGFINYLVAEPAGLTPLTSKSAITHNPEQVSSSPHPSIYV